ncbi:cytochrome c biogenesis protein CcdA [Caldichromatium japonicum]|uniref:Cytochrome c biogenesis protein CcdA n=1 Tax=Caldichromatium japonicum TaxID=2699430 RepID=A0A6G7VB74_9GAMM|nr:cytochrome c biogenesis protein CcdA [Caldichromatium japonicum]QIK37125.1 cytochrome c biogenesis protein CcdA [Caldichromatium japonicum]
MSGFDNLDQLLVVYPLLAFGLIFLAGVVSSASPCVLTTIPLVVGFVGGYADGDRRKAFLYSLSFVIGLSLTFTALGLAAGLFGTLFGTLGGGWYLAVGALALIMGGQMMGLYTIPFPVAPQYRPKQSGLIGAFLLGLFFGAVSSPCATPVLVVILSFVATQGEVLYGAALLFVYAIGHCLLILAAGTSIGFVEAFAKRRGIVDLSAWMRRVGGALVALVGGYLVWSA